MKAFEIGDQQGIASLVASERPDPVPGPGEALLRVRAACLNHRDLLIVSGRYGPRKPNSRIPLSDGVGEVLALGPGVTGPGVTGPTVSGSSAGGSGAGGSGAGGLATRGIAVGDRAICGHFTSWLEGPFAPSIFAADLGVTVDGWLAEKIVVPAAALVPVPATLTDARAVALGAAGLTAWHALVEIGRVKPGDLVLALGTGGVAIFALQLAKLHGARVAITSSSDEKLVQASRLGADILVNYRTTPDWAAAVQAASGGRGADIVVETGGLATLSQSIAAAAPNARIVLIGALAGTPLPGTPLTGTPLTGAPLTGTPLSGTPLTGAFQQALPNFSSIIGKNLTLRGITAGNRRMLTDLARAADANGLVPVIDRAFPFAEAPAAYSHLQSGAHIGKVMVRAIG